MAQENRWSGYVGAGPALPMNPVGSHTDPGWNIGAGMGASGNHVGLMLDFTYDHFGVNSNSLAQVGAPDGRMNVWAFTLDPIVHVTKEGPADVYVTFGGGIYRRNINFTQPGVAETTFFSPWFGAYPALVGVNQVLGSYTVYKGGVDGGVGMSFRLGSSRAKLFAEARYHYMFTSGIATTFVPVTVGLRW